MGSIAAPGYATQVDVFFNDNPVDVIEIGGVEAYNPLYPDLDYTFYIVWDELNTVDQQRLLDLVDEYGGAVPITATDGFQVIDYRGNVVGGDPTGLDTTAAVAGSHTHLYRVAKAGGDPTNLPTENDDGVNERTRFVLDDFPAGAEFFTVSDTATDYYVWYNVPALAEEFNVTHSGISPNGSAYEFSSPTTDYYLNAVDAGQHHLTTFDFTGVGGTLNGSELFRHASGNADFYTWFNRPLAEIVDLDFSAGAGAGLTEGTHLTFSDDTTDFYMWFDRPALPNAFVVDTAGGLNTTQTEADYDGLAGNGTFVDGSGYAALDTITLIDASVITVDSVDAEGRVTGFTVTSAGGTVQPGEALVQDSTSGAGISFQLTPADVNTDGLYGANILAGSHFVFSDSATDFYAWFSVDGVGVDPAPGGTGLEIEAELTDTAINVSEKIEAAILASGAFNIQDGQQTTIRVEAKLAGAELTTAADVDTGLLVSPVAFGRDAGVDPAPGGTGIRVELEDGNTDEEAATAALLALNASDVNALHSLAVDVVTMEMNVAGNVTDAADVDSSVAVVVTQGAANSVDPAAPGTGIQVDITGDETDAELAEAASLAMAAALVVPSLVELNGNVVTVSDFVPALQTLAIDVDSGVTVTTVDAGFDNTTAADATMTVDVAGGIVTAVALTSGGSGYIDGTGFSFLLATTAGGGDGAASISYDVVNGQVTNVAVAVGGTTYTDGLAQAVADVPVSDDNDPALAGTRLAVVYSRGSGTLATSLDLFTDNAVSAIDGEADFNATKTSANTYQVENVNDGAPNAPLNAGNANVALVQTAAGQDGSVDPAPGGTGIQVDYNPASGTSLAQLAGDTKVAMDAILAGLITTVRSGNVLTTTVDLVGPVTPPTGGTTPFDVSILASGVLATARTFTATVYVNNVANPISILGSAASTFTDLITELDADLTDATAAVDGSGNITITADNVGESIFIVDGDLLKNTQDQLRLDTPSFASTNVEYGLVIAVDGVEQTVVISGENAATFTDLAAELTAQIVGADAVVDADGNITIQSDTAGGDETSFGSIKVIRDNLFPHTNGFFQYGIPRPGSDAFVDLLYNGEDDGGDMHFFKYAVRGIGAKPPVGNTNNTSTAVYYNGTAWVRLVDDVPI